MQVLVRIHEPGGSFILAYRVGKTMKSKNVFSFERIFEAVRQEANRPYAYGARFWDR